MDYFGGTEGSRVDRLQWTKPIDPLDTEFKRKYPPEDLGDETISNARVWKVYRDEATTHDTVMLEGWSKTVDVLLIFAGLFSAVVTAFLVESYKLLKPDNSTAYMSTALYLLVSEGNTSTSSLPAPPPISSLVTPGTRWINGLWFTSLLLSLGVALLCILVKQWIGEYTARNGASATDALHWALRRQLYYHAMTAWPVSELVSVLPALLHLSLFLFSAGIVGFLWDLDRALGIWVSILSASLGIFYAGCTLLPLLIPECPTSTPLVSILRRALVRLQILGLRTAIIIQSRLDPWLEPVLQAWQHQETHVTAMNADSIHMVSQSTARHVVRHGVSTLQGKILRLYDQDIHISGVAASIDRRWEQLRADALLWLIFSVPHRDAVAVGIQAICGLREECPTLDRLRADDRFAHYDWESAYLEGIGADQPLEAARIVRSMLRIRIPFALPPQTDSESRSVFLLFYRIHDNESPDLRFLWWFYQRYIAAFGSGDSVALDAWPYYSQSVTVTSTIMSVILAVDLDIHDLLEALSRCRIHAISPSSLTFVLDRVYALAPGSLIRCRHGPHSIALLELLCQMILMPTMSKSTLQHLIAAVTDSAVLRDDFDHPWGFYDFPFLTQYLGSGLCVEKQLDDTSLYRIVAKLMEEPRRYYPGPVALRRLSQALTAALHMSQRAGLIFNGTATKFCMDILDDYINEIPLTWNTPSVVVQSILQPLRLPDLSLSLWDVSSEQIMGPLGLPLADRLAGALCFTDDGYTTPETDLFLSSLRISDLLEMWRRSVDDPEWESQGTSIDCPERFMIVHTIQHCVDLRPMWWFDSLRLIYEGRLDDFESVEQSIHEIESAMSQRGPCTSCPVALRGWYEWDPLSTCGFNPAGGFSPDSPEIAMPASTDRLTTVDEGNSS